MLIIINKVYVRTGCVHTVILSVRPESLPVVCTVPLIFVPLQHHQGCMAYVDHAEIIPLNDLNWVEPA